MKSTVKKKNDAIDLTYEVQKIIVKTDRDNKNRIRKFVRANARRANGDGKSTMSALTSVQGNRRNAKLVELEAKKLATKMHAQKAEIYRKA